MPHLGQRLGHLDAQAVQQQVVLVLVGGEQLGGAVGHRSTHGHHVEGDVVLLSRGHRAEEVGDAHERRLLLAGVGEPHALGRAVVVGPHDDVVAVRVGGEVAVGHLGDEQVVGAGRGELLAERGPEPLLERRVVLAGLGAELPLVAEERRLVDIGGDVVERDALDDLGAQERRDEHLVVGGHLGRAVRQVQVGDVHLRAPLGERPALGHRAVVGVVGAGPDLAEAVHDVQALERVLAVEQAALVDLSKVLLDVRAGECRTAEQDGDVGQPAGVQLLEVVAHDERGLHEQARHADGIGLHLDRLVDHLGHGDLDADVVHLVAVVGEDDVDQVLADVVHVAAHGGQHDAALAARTLDPVEVGLEVGHRDLHGLGRLQHERQLHLALAEELADLLHAVEQDVVDDGERLDALGHRPVEVVGQGIAVAVDDALAQQLRDGPAGAVLGDGLGGLHVLEDVEERRERVVLRVAAGECPGRTAAVPDQVQADVALLVGDAVEREDLGGVHDGRVQADLHALVQEHAVEHVAGGRLEAERHVGETERGVHTGQLGLDAADGLDGGDAVAAQVVVTGRQREGECVEDQVLRLEAVAVDGQVVDPVGDPHLPLDVAGLPLLVDEQADDGGAVLAGQPEHPVGAGALGVAVLEVGGVEHRPAADPLEAGLHDLGLGGVEHEGDRGLRGEPLRDLVHVGGALAADVVDAQVEDVGTLLDLVLGHLHAGVPVGLEHRLAELLGAVGVGPLADQQQVGAGARAVVGLVAEEHR